ncbi:sigma factor-like helix-turn-helix DNA-binding protein [Acidipropionibacterium virtanenii]|uniref:RNA polymerase sigma factor 70 region 4 type 2 domain-containing protein n=1 Tax=Acidipropionibacterium virtanenii TaxID=2057246 RepID=A0A344URL2_9ACTN|nr:sigma factor-like helix-turn-helix DNA-binding protein [Acidipropionibacterium virtanenii]AXE37910.1 hypothetical protein JS278_00719 [Acidipropionibacterium virtanenii]
MADESYTDRTIWLPSLYQEQWEPMVRLAVLLLGGPGATTAAEEIVRDAMVTMYRRDPTLHSWPHAVGYLRASVVNGVRAAVRRRDDAEPGQPVLMAQADEDALTAGADGDGSGADGQEAGGVARGIQVLTALRTLPRRQQEVLILRFYAQASTPDIAEALGITYGAVRSRTERGLAGLAAALDESGERQ